ncbi:MAG: type IV toxin-antitoxin system AbiEi family antitoxin domain-containing protein [Myxococcaceae bacterium]
MRNMNVLPESLRTGLFSASDAKENGVSRYQIEQMLTQGILERLGRGVFRASAGDISEEEWFKVATFWVGEPSAICLLSALSYYNLTDEIPKKTWIMVPHSKLSRHQGLHLVRIRSPKWNAGIDKRQGFWITNIPRTIADAFTHPQIIGSQVAVDSLRRAINENLTSIGAIYEMALELNIGYRILPYVELFS